MTEHPILFSAPMVRALLNGSKTQTRRIVKPQQPSGVEWSELSTDGACWWLDSEDTLGKPYRCPYGVPGDTLWVREKHRLTAEPQPRRAHYMADSQNPAWSPPGIWGPPRPSIHMPRWASRITLRVTDVRVERLNEISHEDCWAEGVVCDIHGAVKHTCCSGLTRGYQKVWEAINGDGSWAANPWVWAVSFEVLHGGGR